MDNYTARRLRAAMCVAVRPFLPTGFGPALWIQREIKELLGGDNVMLQRGSGGGRESTLATYNPIGSRLRNVLVNNGPWSLGLAFGTSASISIPILLLEFNSTPVQLTSACQFLPLTYYY